MIIWFILLLIGAYLLGSLPLSYLAARKHGIDLTEYGTGQVGTGNLFRMTHSWKLGLAVGLFDFGKGALAVIVAWILGFSASLQILAGIAAMIGHNWPLFLHFKGGRGVGTAIGIMIVLPLLHDVPPWIAITFFGIGLTGTLILRSSPLPAFIAFIAVPFVAAVLHVPVDVTLSLAAMTLVVVIKRLAAPRSDTELGSCAVLVNRLLFDRDIRDRWYWMQRKPENHQSKGDRKP